jgi:hypothetical protein
MEKRVPFLQSVSTNNANEYDLALHTSLDAILTHQKFNHFPLTTDACHMKRVVTTLRRESISCGLEKQKKKETSHIIRFVDLRSLVQKISNNFNASIHTGEVQWCISSLSIILFEKKKIISMSH